MRCRYVSTFYNVIYWQARLCLADTGGELTRPECDPAQVDRAGPAGGSVAAHSPHQGGERRLKQSAVETHTIVTGAIQAASFTAHEAPQLTFEGIDDLLADLSKLDLRSQSSSFHHLRTAFVETRLLTNMAVDRF